MGLRADSGRNDLARTRAKTRRWRKHYALQAAIAACHLRGRTAEETDWADLLMKMGKLTEAREEIQRAIAMTRGDR